MKNDWLKQFCGIFSKNEWCGEVVRGRKQQNFTTVIVPILWSHPSFKHAVAC